MQQALGYLANESGAEGAAAAEAKIDDALASTDQEGVDVAAVRQAQEALLDGRTESAQQALQQSIADAMAELSPATGEQTGTTVVGQPLPGRGALTGADWGLGGLSVLLMVAGAGLALRYRPAQNMTQLRRTLSSAAAVGSAPATGAPSADRTSSEGHQS